MPAYLIKLTCEIDVAKTLDEQAETVAKVKALVEAIRNQSLTPSAIEALSGAVNLHCDIKMVGRPARAAVSVPPSDPT